MKHTLFFSLLILGCVGLHSNLTSMHVRDSICAEYNERNHIEAQERFLVAVKERDIFEARAIIENFPVDVDAPFSNVFQELCECVKFQNFIRLKKVACTFPHFLICVDDPLGVCFIRRIKEVIDFLRHYPGFAYKKKRFRREIKRKCDFSINIWLDATAKFLSNNNIILGETPLHTAVVQNDVAMVKLLLEKGASRSIHAFSKTHETTFTRALLDKGVSAEIIDLLLQYGAKDFMNREIISISSGVITPLEVVSFLDSSEYPAIEVVFMRHQRISQQDLDDCSIDQLVRINLLARRWKGICKVKVANGERDIGLFKSFLPAQ